MKFNKLDLDTFHWAEISGAPLEGKYDMPVLEPVHDCSPSKLVPFHIAVSGQRKPEGWYHFYEDDYQFERFWKTPDKYIPKLKNYDGGISTDFSVYLDMPKGQQVWNC